jgi:hypothetical protein
MAEVMANYFIFRTIGPHKLRWKDGEVPHAYLDTDPSSGGYPYLQEDVMRARRFSSREDAEKELDFFKRYTTPDLEIIEVSLVVNT